MDADKIRDAGGPAFPEPRPDLINDHLGMTLRDYFAAAAIMGVAELFHAEFMAPNAPEKCAKCAYAIADAMLAERNK